MKARDAEKSYVVNDSLVSSLFQEKCNPPKNVIMQIKCTFVLLGPHLKILVKT